MMYAVEVEDDGGTQILGFVEADSVDEAALKLGFLREHGDEDGYHYNHPPVQIKCSGNIKCFHFSELSELPSWIQVREHIYYATGENPEEK